MDFKKFGDIFKKVNLNVQIPEYNPIKIEYPEIEFENINEHILEELKINNKELSNSNNKLIQTLHNQHEINLNLQKSNSRVSYANLILVLISLFVAIGGLILNYNAQSMQTKTTEQILQYTLRINELQSELESTQQQTNLLITKYESLKKSIEK